MQDEKIRRRILSRKEEAIAQVMSQYAKTMWHVACAVLHDTGSPQDAEECVADAFLYLWEHADKFDPARGSLKTFLCVVTRSRAMDRRRKLLRQQHVVLDETLLLLRITEVPSDPELHHALTAALHNLSPMEQEILLRRYYHEQKPRAIALALGLSVKKVNNTLYRTKQKLRETLQTQKEAEICIDSELPTFAISNHVSMKKQG